MWNRGVKSLLDVPKCLPSSVEAVYSRNSFPMTAKKKATSTTRAKSIKAKPASTKSTVGKKSLPKTTTPPKKPAAPKKVSKPAKVKPVAKKKAATVKKSPSKPSIKAKPKVQSSQSTSAKSTKASAVAKLRELAAKSNPQNSKEDSAESSGFSISDIRSLLSSRKKTPEKKEKKKAPEKVAVVKVAPKKSAKASKVKKITSASIDDILGFGVPTSNEKQIRRDDNKVPKQWMPFYKSLISLRDALKGSLGERSNETIGASARESGELSLNSSDAGTETFDRDLALSMVANDHEALEEIEDAIDRIFDGSYGTCQQTNKPINKNRLRAVPFTRFSLEGQVLFESGNRKERDQATGTFATISDSTMGQDD
jgi:RNA polymerase-binding transcription factor DksA